MHFFLPTLASILTVAGIAAATPIVPRDTPDMYYLQTKVVGDHKDYGTDKNNLWLYSSHTGAGLGSAALSSNKTYAWEGYLNGTQALFTYPNSPGPWPMYVNAYGPYQAWNTISISIAGQSTSSVEQVFFFNQTGFQFDQSYDQSVETSAGWLACDWWYGSVQLFSIAAGYFPQIPASCSKVQLYPVSVS